MLKTIPLLSAMLLATSTHAAHFFAAESMQLDNVAGANPPQYHALSLGTSLPIDGVYRGGIDYVTGPVFDQAGNPTASGHARVSTDIDMRAGLYKLSAESSLPGHGGFPPVGGLSASGSVSFEDNLTVHVAGATASTVTYIELTLTTRGAFSGTDPDALARFSSSLGLRNVTTDVFLGDAFGAGASVNNSYRTNDGTYGQGSAFYDTPRDTFSSAVAGLQFGNADVLRVRVPVYGETALLDLDIGFDIGASYALADFAHTSVLTAQLPAGTTITGFDGAAFLAPVPEPATGALLAAGVLLVGWRGRRISRAAGVSARRAAPCPAPSSAAPAAERRGGDA